MQNFSSSLPSFACCNPKADKSCRQVMALFKSLYGRHILTAQHTNSRFTDEFKNIHEITGQYPAMIGIDLLSVGQGAVPYLETAKELRNNMGSVEMAIRWVKEHRVLLTVCWHWHSPLGYKQSHSFYKRFTDFDFPAVMREKGEGYQLLLKDMDAAAEKLRQFQQEGIPVLWRPLHEANGVHFWWGNDPAPYLELYRLMYDRFTNYHGLNHLIWVWNGEEPQLYPGDDCVDISGLDNYAHPFNCGTLENEWNALLKATSHEKPMALTEVSSPPDMERLQAEKVPWLWFMLWNGFPNDPKNNTHDLIRAAYNHPYALTEEGLHKHWDSICRDV